MKQKQGRENLDFYYSNVFGVWKYNFEDYVKHLKEKQFLNLKDS